MHKKKCRICNQEKDLTDFHKRKVSKDGHRNECKDCYKIFMRKYYEENKDELLKKNKKYKNNNIEFIKKKKHEYYQNNRNHELERNKEWRNKNEDKVKNLKRKYYNENKEKINENIKEWRKNNVEKVQEYEKNYRKNNRERIKKLKRFNCQKRYRNDLLFKLKSNIRSLIKISLKSKGFTKKSKTYKILGCSFEELKKHLFENAKIRYSNFKENDFLEKGKYHIDHIIPLTTANSEEDIIKLNHYTNLQLLTAEDNLNKGISLNWDKLGV